MSKELLVVLILFHIKHFFGDFPLQTTWMLGKGKSGLAWITPLSAHCLVHASLSLLIILFVNQSMAYLVIFEFIAHFVIDRMKATYRLPQGQWANEDKGKYLSKYYFAFGMDQLSHHICYIIMTYFLFQ